jgi:ribosomal protein S6--L-glutamate ligase
MLGKPPKVLIGWQEWCTLPKLHVPAIKAKIDSGAKTSALHASDIHSFHRHGQLFVQFLIHPLQRTLKFETTCTALVADQRMVMNSGGHKELRYVITTAITLGQMTWEIDITLTNRDPMTFRMLLGRDALKGHSIIDPGKILCHGKLKLKQLRSLYASHKSLHHS